MNKGCCFKCDDSDEYVAYNCKTLEEAWNCILQDYPEIIERYTEQDLRLTFMSKCLDCGWFNIEPTDDSCGQCAEFRISNRKIKCFYLTKL